MLIGFSLCKNLNIYQYPIRLCIDQHKNLVDKYYFIVPKANQDIDGTRTTVVDICEELKVSFEIFEVDWPGQEGFGQESIDKIQQQKLIDYIDEKYEDYVWLIKLDVDEFIHEKEFQKIKNLVKDIGLMDVSSISFNYLQFLGSVEFTCFDPTERTVHLFKNRSGAFFAGNDAMNITTDGNDIYMDDIYIHHIGYVKSEEILTIKLKEHFRLNESVYSDLSGLFKHSKESNIKFEFPKHKNGAKLWPLGIAAIRGSENCIEYKAFDTKELPFILRENVDKLRFHMPNLE